MQTLVETAISNALVAGALALVAFAVSRLRRPALAHGLWLLVLVKLITPPLLPVYLPAFASEPTAQVESLPPKTADPELLHFASPEDLAAFLALAELSPDSDLVVTPAAPEAPKAEPTSLSWQDCVIPLWIGGAVIWLGLTLSSVCRFQWLLRSARPAPKLIQNQTRQLAARLGLKYCPQVWLVPGALSPMIWAIGAAPRLLFPTGLLDRLDGEQRAALLLHELAHVHRRDHWVRFVELLVVALYWWNPVVWWARRELREAEEQCCDAWVVWASRGEGTAYARALLETVAFVSRTRFPLPASASGIGHIPHLRRRLTMIMQANTPRSLSAAGWLLLGLAAFLLPVAARAQTPDKGDDRDRAIKALKDRLRALEDQSRDKKVQLDHVVDVIAELVIDEGEEVSDNPQANEDIAKLKKQIAAKRAELKDLEAKLKSIVAGMKGKKDGKVLKYIDLKGLKDLKIEMIDEKEVPKGAILLERIDDLKKHGIVIENLDELKKLGNISLDIDVKNLDELKKLGDINIIKAKKLDELKEVERAKALREEAEMKAKIGTRKAEDIDARLDRLMKEIQELRREIQQNKGRQQK